MSELPENQDLLELQALRSQTEALIEQLEDLKLQGAEAQTRVEAFYQEHDLQPGDGLRALTSDKVDPSDQYVFLKLMAALEQLPQAIADCGKAPEPAAASTISAPLRALNHRYRI